MAKKIGIVYCQRIQDQSCIGCAKKQARERHQGEPEEDQAQSAIPGE